MALKALLCAYVLGGLTFIPLLVAGVIIWAAYTSIPVDKPRSNPSTKTTIDTDVLKLEVQEQEEQLPRVDTNDLPKPRKGWLAMRRTFEEIPPDGGYVGLVRSLLDSRSKDPKKSRPKDMWYVVLKGKVLYLYEDEDMTDCEAVVELGSHDVVIYPEGLPDGELFTKRNAICLKPKASNAAEKGLPSVSRPMKLSNNEIDAIVPDKERAEAQRQRDALRDQASDSLMPWFMFVRNTDEMEDWYLALVHAAGHPAQTPTLTPLQSVFRPADMYHLVTTLDEQPDVIPMRWLNALVGRLFLGVYKTQSVESYIIGRLMKKLAKVKRPGFLTEILVTEVSVGNRAPQLSKPMLKELTKEGDAAMEVHLQYKGEIRITVQATVTINLGARFKSYTVKLVLAAVLKELDGNLLIKVKRPPSNRIWYAFTQPPHMILEVEPIVSDRQITWSMILGQIESFMKTVVQESVVMPNMDDIAFFESLPYQHRGGIWADAAQQENTLASQLEQASTFGAPQIVLQPTRLSAPSSMPVENVTMPPQSQILDDNELPSALAAGDPRRKSWFSNVRLDNASSVAPKSTSQVDVNETAKRGRPSETEKQQRAPSQSSHKRDLSPSTQSEQTDASDFRSRSPSPQTSRRSSSRHSNKQGAFSNGGPYLDDTKGTSATRKSAESVRPTTPGSSGNGTLSSANFLSSLKSRASDKQALKDTAKETMRKWATNWNSLRNKDKEAITPTQEELPDYGSVGLQDHDIDTGNPYKPRSNYADVRAAVAQRKERGKNNNGDGNSDSEGSVSQSNITESVESKARVAVGSSNLISGRSEDTSLPSARPSTVERLLPTKRSSPSIATINTDLDANNLSVDIPKSAPIQSQPQAKIMMIPGIHASHRNDIMSMGYVAPQPLQPSQLNKVGIQGIQNVYRLWKGTSIGQAQSDNSTSANVILSSEPDPGLLGNEGNVPTGSQSITTPRLIPPPLPPRSMPHRPLTSSDTNHAMSDHVPRFGVTSLPVSTSPLPRPLSSSSASEALKVIALKDESTRVSAENEEPSVLSTSGAINPQQPDIQELVSDPPSTQNVVSAGVNDSHQASRKAPPLPPRPILAPTA